MTLVPDSTQTEPEDADPTTDRPAPTAPLSEEDAGRYLNVTRAFLEKCRYQNRGPAYLRIGRMVRYRIADLDDWLLRYRVRTKESS